MTPEHCQSQIRRLNLLKGTPENIVEYFAALQDIPNEIFTAAINHALKTRAWFPTPAELRVDCDAVPRRVSPEEPDSSETPEGPKVEIRNPFGGPSIWVTVTRDWKWDCETCRDTGWAARWCGEGNTRALDPLPVVHCGRKREHGSHEWMELCSCADWNPTLRRRKEAGAKYAKAAAKAGA